MLSVVLVRHVDDAYICAVLVCWNIVTIYVLYSAAIATCLTVGTVQSREEGDLWPIRC